MEKNPPNEAGAGAINRAGPVTREMIRTRTRELALIAGRPPPDVSQTDYEQAKRELTGEFSSERQDALLDSLPESERWDPVPGSRGRQAPESLNEDEDAEGRSEIEQLVERGVDKAGRDHARQADQEAAKTEADEPRVRTHRAQQEKDR